MAIMRAVRWGLREEAESRDDAPEEAHRRSGEVPRVTMQKLTYTFLYISCVRANADPKGENHGSGTGVFLIGRSMPTGCGGRPTLREKSTRIIPYSLYFANRKCWEGHRILLEKLLQCAYIYFFYYF